jgi:hypothetical protein
MKRRRLDSASRAGLRRWIGLESTDTAADEERDSALAEVFTGVAAPAPADDLSKRIVRAARAAPLSHLRRPLVPVWITIVRRAAVAIAIIGAGYLSAVRLLPLLAGQFVAAINMLAQACLWMAMALSAGRNTWSVLTDVARALALTAAAPQVSTAVILAAVIGTVAMYLLQRLLESDREHSR